MRVCVCLEDRGVEGKIVVFNEPWAGYGGTVAYRSGAVQAAQQGAVGALIRSVTPFSIYSPHTGMMTYKVDTHTRTHSVQPILGGQDGVPQIPAACITIEDAEMLDRMQARGQRIRVRMQLGAQLNGTVTSRNTVFELTGTEWPEQVMETIEMFVARRVCPDCPPEWPL